MRLAIAALIAATIYLVGRRHRSWVEPADGPRAPIEDIDWLDDFSPVRVYPGGTFTTTGRLQ